MKDYIINVLNDMSEDLSIAQLKKLQEVLVKRLEEKDAHHKTIDNNEYLSMFINSKRIEECSERTLYFYESSVRHLLKEVLVPVRRITTDQIRDYLSDYQK